VIEIGVILPTYNRPELAARAIRSVLSQTYAHWKIYIVDDGSTEDTKGFLETHHLLSDQRISMNDEVDFVVFLDDDDYFVESYFADAVACIQEYQIDWLVTTCVTPDRQPVTKVYQEGKVSYLSYFLGESLYGDATMQKSISKKGLSGVWV